MRTIYITFPDNRLSNLAMNVILLFPGNRYDKPCLACHESLHSYLNMSRLYHRVLL